MSAHPGTITNSWTAQGRVGCCRGEEAKKASPYPEGTVKIESSKSWPFWENRRCEEERWWTAVSQGRAAEHGRMSSAFHTFLASYALQRNYGIQLYFNCYGNRDGASFCCLILLLLVYNRWSVHGFFRLRLGGWVSSVCVSMVLECRQRNS